MLLELRRHTRQTVSQSVRGADASGRQAAQGGADAGAALAAAAAERRGRGGAAEFAAAAAAVCRGTLLCGGVDAVRRRLLRKIGRSS